MIMTSDCKLIARPSSPKLKKKMNLALELSLLIDGILKPSLLLHLPNFYDYISACRFVRRAGNKIVQSSP